MENLVTYSGHSELLKHNHESMLSSLTKSKGWTGDSKFLSDHEESISDEEIKSIGRKFLLFQEPSKKRIEGETLSEISNGLNMVATGIKIVTTLLTLLGADTVDRYEINR